MSVSFFRSVRFIALDIGMQKRRPRVVKRNDKQTNKPFSLIAFFCTVFMCVCVREESDVILFFLHFHESAVDVAVVFRHRLFPFSIFHGSAMLYCGVM